MEESAVKKSLLVFFISSLLLGSQAGFAASVDNAMELREDESSQATAYDNEPSDASQGVDNTENSSQSSSAYDDDFDEESGEPDVADDEDAD